MSRIDCGEELKKLIVGRGIQVMDTPLNPWSMDERYIVDNLVIDPRVIRRLIAGHTTYGGLWLAVPVSSKQRRHVWLNQRSVETTIIVHNFMSLGRNLLNVSGNCIYPADLEFLCDWETSKKTFLEKLTRLLDGEKLTFNSRIESAVVELSLIQTRPGE